MPNKSWELGFHLRSPRNWLNDPNGLCQFRGSYYFFYQYDHDWPVVDQKAWGLFTSPDLIHWTYQGVPIEPSVPQDRHGVFSGSAFVERGAAADGGDRLRVYYTGNVVDPVPGHSPKDFDYVYAGREGNTLTCTSDDDPAAGNGVTFGPKQVLLTNADYPDECSCHVRDPKVWEQDGKRRMLLGARHKDTRGMCLLFDSDDGLSWTFCHAINSAYSFGFVWECPNNVRLDGREYLAISPQGLPRLQNRWFNRWTPGYFELPAGQRLIDTEVIDERTFVQWDFGHDFYAPQTFVDDAGRTILVGWMGTFDEYYTSVPDGLSWWHCMTVPRVVTRRADGRLLQNPAPELEALRGTALELTAGGTATISGRFADLVLTGIEGAGSLRLDDSFEIFYEDGRLGIRYLDEAAAAGRTSRSIPLDQLSDLRVLVDGSAVEIFANGGAETFASRWFCPETPDLTIASDFGGSAYPMTDTMAELYETAAAQAPDLTMPGWNETIDH